MTMQEFREAVAEGRSDFQDEVFKDVVFDSIKLNNGTFKYCAFLHCCFDSCTFNQCAFTKAKFINTDMVHVEFIHCSMDDAMAQECIWNDVVFTQCRMEFMRCYACRMLAVTFKGCYMEGVDFHASSLGGVVFDDVKDIFIPERCPSHGSFIAWKKLGRQRIAKLEIPEHAKRHTMNNGKLRVSEAKVLEIWRPAYEYELIAQNMHYVDGPMMTVNGVSYVSTDRGYSHHHHDFEYKLGEVVKPEKPYDDDRFKECASGIHCFMSIEEAVRYIF